MFEKQISEEKVEKVKDMEISKTGEFSKSLKEISKQKGAEYSLQIEFSIISQSSGDIIDKMFKIQSVCEDSFSGSKIIETSPFKVTKSEKIDSSFQIEPFEPENKLGETRKDIEKLAKLILISEGKISLQFLN